MSRSLDGLPLRLRWARRWRGLIVRHAPDLAERSIAPCLATSQLAPLAAHIRWHEHHADLVLADRPARGTPPWLRQWQTRTVRVPLGDAEPPGPAAPSPNAHGPITPNTAHASLERGRLLLDPHADLLPLGVDLLQAVVAGNRVDVRPEGPEADAQTLLLELASTAWRSVSDETCPINAAPDDHSIDRAEPAERVKRPTTAAIVTDHPEHAARQAWAALTGSQPGLPTLPALVLVRHELLDRFATTLRPRAAGAKPRHVADPATAYRFARRALGQGASSASGIVEPKTVNSRFRPVVLLDASPEAFDSGEDADSPAQSPAIPVQEGVMVVVPFVEAEEARQVLALLAPVIGLGVFSDQPGKVDLDGWGHPSVLTRNAWPMPLAHPSAAISIQGRPVGGAEGLLSWTRMSVTCSGRTGAVEAATTQAAATNQRPGWFNRLYRAPVGNAVPDLWIRSKPSQSSPNKRRSKVKNTR